MDRAALFAQAIERRRAFHLPGYTSYARAGFDGPWTCPIQITSGSLSGPVLMTKDWLDFPSAERHRQVLCRLGYLPGIPFNTVLDKALKLAGLARNDIYITPVFKLMPAHRSHPIPSADVRASLDAVTRHEIMDRPVVAAGQDAVRALQAAGIPHIATPHPSARGQDFDSRARVLALALTNAIRAGGRC